jgi:cytosine/adenosine deaminase-related metal-dependent hydrolase
LDTGGETELAGGVFPVEEGEDERDAYADAMQAGQEWLDEGGTVVSS